MANWYLQKGDQRIGPVPLETLQGMAATGQIAAPDLVWTDGMPAWQPAGSQAWFRAVPPPPPPPTPSMSFGGYAPNFPPTAPPPAPLPNLTMWSILVLLFCCLPGGIVGLIQSNRAKKEWAQGNYAAAQSTAKSAQTTLIVCAIIGFVIIAARIGMVLSNQ